MWCAALQPPGCLTCHGLASTRLRIHVSSNEQGYVICATVSVRLWLCVPSLHSTRNCLHQTPHTQQQPAVILSTQTEPLSTLLTMQDHVQYRPRIVHSPNKRTPLAVPVPSCPQSRCSPPSHPSIEQRELLLPTPLHGAQHCCARCRQISCPHLSLKRLRHLMLLKSRPVLLCRKVPAGWLHLKCPFPSTPSPRYCHLGRSRAQLNANTARMTSTMMRKMMMPSCGWGAGKV